MSDAAPTYTVFSGSHLVLRAALPELLAYLHAQGQASFLIFEDEGGRAVDFDVRGTLADVLGRYAPRRAGPGRPRLGVVSREVSLLPRHWAWLETQRGGASAALRRLVDDARRADPDPERRRQATEAAGRVMTALAGDLPGYEEASRALYAGDTAAGNTERLRTQMRTWPADVQAYVLGRLEAGAAGMANTTGPGDAPR